MEENESGTDDYGRTLYAVTCSKCGKNTEVPFKPADDRPVYCKNCYIRPERRRPNVEF